MNADAFRIHHIDAFRIHHFASIIMARQDISAFYQLP
jgi:hypothetical protein